MPPRVKWLQSHLEFLEKNYPLVTRTDLTILFNQEFGLERTDGQVTSAVKNHRILCNRKKHILRASTMWPASYLEFLRKNCPSLSRKELTAALNAEFGLERTESQVVAAVKNNKIKSGRLGYFSSESPRWNRGTKGVCKANSGSFQRGAAPPNIKPIGSERMSQGFVLIKVAEPDPYTNAPTRYKAKHNYVWEQANGAVPEGMVVAFTDGNRLNCAIENLMLISRQELLNLNRHGYIDAPDEIKPSLLALAKLEVRLHALEKRTAKKEAR